MRHTANRTAPTTTTTTTRNRKPSLLDRLMRPRAATTTTTRSSRRMGRRHRATATTAPVHHHQRKPTLGDRIYGALLRLKGSVTGRSGKKAAGTRRMRGTDGRGSTTRRRRW
ncbi:hypothetical protein FN846DRAFT_960403 [Sphaerosporella brunnea]|uniref:Uncharacterized protein n=1 Tax=Sphaerosporella brunnea TaxID=1250544 RepID=A0A5J5EPS5_9PEZI|nr:hypothetical protein FN846DRAFT_960403 [Sphaerosporella brunnea]